MKSVSMSDKVGGTAGAKFTHTSEVLTRYFYNFKCQYRRVTGLLAKGNKKKASTVACQLGAEASNAVNSLKNQFSVNSVARGASDKLFTDTVVGQSTHSIVLKMSD